MMEPIDLEEAVNKLRFFFHEPEYFEHWFKRETIQEAQLLAAQQYLPMLILDWQRMRAEERERNALSK